MGGSCTIARDKGEGDSQSCGAHRREVLLQSSLAASFMPPPDTHPYTTCPQELSVTPCRSYCPSIPFLPLRLYCYCPSTAVCFDWSFCLLPYAEQSILHPAAHASLTKRTHICLVETHQGFPAASGMRSKPGPPRPFPTPASLCCLSHHTLVFLST